MYRLVFVPFALASSLFSRLSVCLTFHHYNHIHLAHALVRNSQDETQINWFKYVGVYKSIMIRKYLLKILRHINCLWWQGTNQKRNSPFSNVDFTLPSLLLFAVMSVDCHWLSYSMACYSAAVSWAILMTRRWKETQRSLVEENPFCLFNKSLQIWFIPSEWRSISCAHRFDWIMTTEWKRRENLSLKIEFLIVHAKISQTEGCHFLFWFMIVFLTFSNPYQNGWTLLSVKPGNLGAEASCCCRIYILIMPRITSSYIITPATFCVSKSLS